MAHIPEKEPTDPMRDVLDIVVRSATGQSPTEVSPLRADADYWIGAVRTAAGDPLIVKLITSPAVPAFEAARLKHDIVRRAVDIPMAQMLAADDSRTLVPYRYSIQTRLAGEEWFTRRNRLDATERDRALANLGDIVGRLHQPQPPSFGALPGGAETKILPALTAHAQRIIGNAALADRFTTLLAHHAALWIEAIPPAFTHDDLHGFNILFHPDRAAEVSGILDFDKTWSGPAESDLARMELWRGMTSPAFLASYRARIPEIAGYRERRPFYQLLWCLEFAQNTPDHLQTTNGLLARLGLPPIEAFE